MTKLLFVLWVTGATTGLGADKTPADWWHPIGVYSSYKACRQVAGDKPKGYAKRMICLRMRYDRAFKALPQKAQPR